MENRERVIIKLVPTFQALRDIDTLGRGDGGSNTIRGETFADCINNFFVAADTVASHLDWVEQERRDVRHTQRGQGRCSVPSDVKVAELIFAP
jgi:hypothetical protein